MEASRNAAGGKDTPPFSGPGAGIAFGGPCFTHTGEHALAVPVFLVAALFRALGRPGKRRADLAMEGERN